MDKTLLTFFISFIVVVIICLIIAIIRQLKINKNDNNNSSTVSGSGNHGMNASKYSGRYRTCRKYGVANETFRTQ